MVTYYFDSRLRVSSFLMRIADILLRSSRWYVRRLFGELKFVLPVVFGGILILEMVNLKVGGDGVKATIEDRGEAIKKEIVYWQKVTDAFPYFRDAYIKLAVLNFRVDRLLDARKYLEMALEIDPNNEVTKELLKKLK